jgi:hypothetical protein
MTRIISLALAASVFYGTIATAATCLSSAADVRWYAGKKPVFAKATKKLRQVKAQSQPGAGPHVEPTSAAPASPGLLKSQGRNNNIPQPWGWPK